MPLLSSQKRGIDENIKPKNTFLIKNPEKKVAFIDTLNDFRKRIHSLVEEGKGEWPVVYMPPDPSSYHKIKLSAIVPGNALYEGLQLLSSFHGTPKGEYILVQTFKDIVYICFVVGGEFTLGIPIFHRGLGWIMVF